MLIESRIQSALEDLKNGRFSSIRKAAQFHKVPRSTLQDRVNGRHSRQSSRATLQLLSPREEEMLARWCLDLEIVAQAPTQVQIRELASLILRCKGDPSVPGHNWVAHFMRRNPQVKSKEGRMPDRQHLPPLKNSLDKDCDQALQQVPENGTTPSGSKMSSRRSKPDVA